MAKPTLNDSAITIAERAEHRANQAESERDALREQRDELLAACEAALDDMGELATESGRYHISADTIALLRAALAKVKS